MATESRYRKYAVRKVSDPERKHENCLFVVLDLDHDPHAHAALRAYSEAAGRPQWVEDLLAQTAGGQVEEA